MASHNSGHSNGGNQYVRLTDKSADDSYDNGMASNEDIESGVDRKARAKRYGLIGGRRENEPMTQECLGRFSRFCHQCSDIKEDPAGGIADGEDEYMKKIIFTGLETGLAGTYCYYFQFIIHNTFCDFIFNCHCTWTWAGGWEDCNVHNTEGKPKCPWCMARQSVEWTTNILPFLCMFAIYIYTLYHRKKCDYILARIAAATATYFIAGVIVGLVFFLASPNYDYFMGIKT